MPEVVGYVYDYEVYCPSCCPVDTESPDVAPIFDDSEWDYIPTCCECRSPLDVSFTWHGLIWTAGEVGVFVGDNEEHSDEEAPGEIDEELLRQFLSSFLRVGLRWVEACIDHNLLAEPKFDLNEFYYSRI